MGERLRSGLTKSVVVDRITRKTLERQLRDLPPDSMKFVWTDREVELLAEYVPSTHFRVTNECPLRGQEVGDWLELGDDLLIDQSAETAARRARLAFQLQSELVNKASTLDSAIICGRRDLGTVGSKIYNLDRHYRMLALLGLPGNGFKPPETLDLVSADETRLDDILIDIKLQYAGILRQLPEWLEIVPHNTRGPELSAEQKERFNYVERMRELVGDALVALVLYGSASREEDPSKSHDYDNYAVVRAGSLGEICPRLRGTKLVHTDGKPIQLNLVEDVSFAKIIRYNHDPSDTAENSVVLHGEVNFPSISEDELLQRGASHAVLRTKSLKSACSLAARDPDFFIGKPNLFDYFQKTLLFIMQSSLTEVAGPGHRTKDELTERLAELGMFVLPFRPNPTYTRQATYQASAWATELLEKHFDGKQFDDGIMLDV